MYSLKNIKTGELIKYSIESNEGEEFCSNNTFTLSESGEYFWVVDSLEIVKYAMTHDTPWYNSGMESPTHSSSFKSEDWVPVKLNFKEVK